MSIGRIKRSLKLNADDVVLYCKNKILNKNYSMYK